MNKKAKDTLERVRKYFDEQVMSLSPAEYKYVISEMASTLESYEDCLRDEEEEEEA